MSQSLIPVYKLSRHLGAWRFRERQGNRIRLSRGEYGTVGYTERWFSLLDGSTTGDAQLHVDVVEACGILGCTRPTRKRTKHRETKAPERNERQLELCFMKEY